MSKLLRADFYRMYAKKRFWIAILGMVLMSLMFVSMQYSGMDYVVKLDRVIFLPMSFYGIFATALISLFIGDDFSDGVVRNKIIAGRSRRSIYFSNMITATTANLFLYFTIVATTFGVGIFLFENNVDSGEFIQLFLLGTLTCVALGVAFSMISLLIGNKATSVMVCMGIAFVLLVLCLNTNQILVQQPYKDGVLNPHYVSGIRRVTYEILHDINPMGQVAQLSAMECYSAVRWILCDSFWIVVASIFGKWIFERKDIM